MPMGMDIDMVMDATVAYRILYADIDSHSRHRLIVISYAAATVQQIQATHSTFTVLYTLQLVVYMV